MNTSSAISNLNSTVKGTASMIKDEASKDMASVADDLAALKKDFAVLLKHVKSNAGAGASEALSQISDHAHEWYDTLADQSAKSAKMISRQVEAQPLTSLLVAFAVGFITGKVLSAR